MFIVYNMYMQKCNHIHTRHICPPFLEYFEACHKQKVYITRIHVQSAYPGELVHVIQVGYVVWFVPLREPQVKRCKGVSVRHPFPEESHPGRCMPAFAAVYHQGYAESSESRSAHSVVNTPIV